MNQENNSSQEKSPLGRRIGQMFSSRGTGGSDPSEKNIPESISSPHEQSQLGIQNQKQTTDFLRIASESARKLPTFFSLEKLLEYTASLICEQFGYYHAGIYLLDGDGLFLTLRASSGGSTHDILVQSPRLRTDGPSIPGIVSTTLETYVAQNVETDNHYIKNDLLPDTKAQLGIPILLGSRLAGVLDIHSQKPVDFDESTISALQLLAHHLALGLKNLTLIESSQIDPQSINEIYRYGSLISQASSESEILALASQVMRATPFDSILAMVVDEHFQILANTTTDERPLLLDIPPDAFDDLLSSGSLIGNVTFLQTLPGSYQKILVQAGFVNIALIPVRRAGKIKVLLTIGSKEQRSFSPVSIHPFGSLAEIITFSLEQLKGSSATESRLGELESITQTSQALSEAKDLNSLFSVLHDHVRKIMGEVSFLVALYQASTNSIRIPYMVEMPGNSDKVTVEAFPLGEGLTSVLIRTKQPLLLAEDTERKALALGAKIVGKPAKTWMGVPLIVANDVIGAIVVQDSEHEHAFGRNELRYLTTLSAQVAGAINNIILVEETQKRALQLQTAAEIARDISGSLDISELLARAVSLIRDRFNFYHASVFLCDTAKEFAVIREATGDAGMQLKHSGHKLRIGSKSVVGYVTGSGEHLVVNDTNRDATYLPNPLLPETRSEVAMPLRVGQRILGAIDVQSITPYAFSNEDIYVLRILADQLAIAVVNSELFAETQEHLSQHRLLHHVTSAAASGTTLSEALNSAAQGLQVTLGGDRVAILLADRSKKVLRVEAIAGYSEEVKKMEITFGEGVTGWVAVHLQPLRIDDVGQDTRYIEAGSNIRSELAIPLAYRGELLGVLNVESDQLSAYSENDEELLGTLGGSLAAIIANARLLEQIRLQVDHERLVFEVTNKIRRSSDMQTIISTTATELTKALGARRAQIKVNIKPESTGIDGD